MNGEDQYLAALYQRFPVNLVRGKGTRVWDAAGKEYIDCMGGYGVALVGHCNDRVVAAIKKQADTLITAHMSVYNNMRLKFMEKMSTLTPPGLSKMFFTNSGAESVEGALKVARKYTGKHCIIAMNGAYHGKTFGAPSVTCIAKGIAGGIPMGLIVAKAEIMEATKLGEHSSTFCGSPLACAAGTATLEALTDDNLVENAAKIGTQFKEGLKRLTEKHKIILEVRGLGMMLGVELRFAVKDVLFDVIRNGLLMLYSGRNIIRLLPPLVMDETTISRVVDIMDFVLTSEEKRRNVS